MPYRIEYRPFAVEQPIFPVSAEQRLFAEWCETMGASGSVQRVPRCEYARWIRDPHRDQECFLLPYAARTGELPAMLSRLMREFPPDSRMRDAMRSLSSLLHEAMGELLVRIRASWRPHKLKRAMSRYRRFAEALDTHMTSDAWPMQTRLRWYAPDRAESDEMTVRLLDGDIARACLEAFFEIFLSRARGILVSGASRFTRFESDVARREADSVGPEALFRCDRSELSVRPTRLADLFVLTSASHGAYRDPDRILRALVLEIAAYPWESDSDGANAGVEYILGRKRMGCVGKSLLLHAFLDHARMDHEALDMFDHSALFTRTPHGRTYLDPTNFISPVDLSTGRVPIGAYGYESLDIAELPAALRAARPMPASSGIMAQIFANIASEYARRRQYRDALALLERARDLAPGSAPLLGLSGRVSRLAGDPIAARWFLEQAVEYCPQDARSSRELAAILLSDGRYGRAKTLYSWVAARDGAPAAAWYDYGVACAYDRDDDRAIDAFDRVLADDPDHTRALDLRFHILHTVALERGREFQRKSSPAPWDDISRNT